MTDPPRAIRAGRTLVVAHTDREHLWRHVDKLSSSERTVRKTHHFVVCQPAPGKRGQVVLMHTFNRGTIDEDLPAVIADELGPLGVVSTAREYDDTLQAIVASTSPTSSGSSGSDLDGLDLLATWRHYGLNTLRRLRPLVSEHSTRPTALRSSHIAQFATVYRRIIECTTGASLLDVGTSLGFLPILATELYPSMTVVGCDHRQDAISCATDLAAATGSHRLTFLLRDVLSEDFPNVGAFDTVTAVHLLEHLTEDQMPVALTNMLSVTAKLLIVSVPYEDNLQALYGHRQAFTLEKLRLWGQWCADRLAGGRFHCENIGGGLLIVENPQGV